ncbi:MAG: hypothetical protein KDK70_28580 [Myxococcales bacterium]|nr:hypothetical protein [Myxococcales bacterium]
MLDIRALSAVIDTQRARPSASASSVALPSFTAPWTTQHLLPSPSPAPKTSPPRLQGADNRPLYAMIGALSLAVASLGVYVVLRPPAPLVVEEPPPLDPIVVVAGASRPEPEPEPEPMAEPEPEPEPAVAVATAESEPEPEPAHRRTRNHREPRSGREQSQVAAPKTKTKTKDDGMVSVECIIDPSKCTKRGRPRDPEPDEPASTQGLPKTPSASQIRSAMAEVKPDAKACGSRHGASSGTTVRVKLSARGSTGAITGATPLDEHAGTALGRCVAQALTKATLPRFSKAQAGIVYAVRL